MVVFPPRIVDSVTVKLLATLVRPIAALASASLPLSITQSCLSVTPLASTVTLPVMFVFSIVSAFVIVFDPELFANPAQFETPVSSGPGKPHASKPEKQLFGVGSSTFPLTTAPAAEVAGVDPPLFVAVTTTRRVWPTSVEARM